ncbi:type 4b pilus protein PilO2 [Aquincola sp. S2]|uniref:Type 4b pilus protein PilO2 n=1 Tax=Pseudaquabacterium terrae TaxID=2732868 RepID=A0ABX2EIJ2_9BURK|nr:type 4b pilus protein PilO2 [Aquabacterium terrae]NRF68449.1 type 4b pilus protein PilO2 [Aquabacterium terrae]
MSAQIVQIGKDRFICGLFWQSLSRPRELNKEAVELGRRMKFDLFVILRDYGTVQAGYANAIDGAKSGVYSLGSAVAKGVALEGAHYEGKREAVASWLAAVKVGEDKYAYFAVRDHCFLPNGDFAGSKQEVIDRLTSDYALGGWNVVFGDEELREIGFHNFQARGVGDFLPRGRGGAVRVHRWWRMRPLVAPRWAIAATIGGVASVVALAALWVQYTDRRAALEKAVVQQASRVVPSAHAAPPPPHPWPGQPLPADFVRACTAAFAHFSPGGWPIDSYDCNGNLATHAWKRGNSFVEYLRQAVPEAAVDLEGNGATLARPLSTTASGRDEPLLLAKDVLAQVVSSLQMLGLKPQLTLVPPPPPPPAPQGAALAPAPLPPSLPDWQTFRLSVNTGGLAPSEVVAVLQQPGVRLGRLLFNGTEWSIEGVIYAK